MTVALPTASEITAALIAREELPAEKGDIGPQGLQGPDGQFGPPGPQGPKGDPGRDGVDGAPGDLGPVGPQGKQGDRGLKGDKGDKGDEGDRGEQGPIGPTGASGSGRSFFPRGGGGGSGGSQTALTTPFTPAGSIAATNVQAAIEEVAAEAGSSALIGAATPLEIVANAIDVTGLHYVLLDGEGSADDILETITGGVDGQFIVLESVGPEIVIVTYTATINSADQEAGGTLRLGNFITQAFALYSANDGKWQIWSNQRPSGVISEDGQTELIADDTLGLQGYANTQLIWRALPRGLGVVGLILQNTAPPADGDIDAAEAAFWFDATNGAAAIGVKAKTLDGTIVTATIPLTAA